METNLAVLIDFENIAAGAEKEGLGRFDIKAVMQRFKDKGRVLIARSYADWGRFSRFKQQLLTENVTMYELTSHGMQDKNRADIALVVDALELAFTKDYIDAFVIVSGDSDFTPMVLKMRELNKQVIGCGTRKSTSRLLIQACDEFVFYDSIVKPPSSKKRRPKVTTTGGGVTSKQAAFALLLDAVEGLQRENPDPPLAGVVKQTMRRKSPDFSESELGYPTFTRFLEAAQGQGHVHVIRDPKAGGVRVDLLEGGNDDESEDAPAPKSGWSDEYLPAGSEMWVNALDEVGFHPLSYSTRMDVIEAIVQAVAERKKRRRKTNVQFVTEDVKKALRRTHPELPVKRIKGVLEALRAGDQLVHKDGGAIRTANASFRLNKDSVGLNKALLGVYLGYLREAGAELVDAPALSELFLGTRDRSREVEETLAWMNAPEPELDLNDKDLDDLLLADEADAPKADEADAKSEDAEEAEAKADEKAEEEPKAEEKPKAKPKAKAKAKPRTRKKKKADEPKAEEDEKAEEPKAEDADEKAEEPKKPRRRRVRKKPEPKQEAPSDLDALLESAE